MGKLHITIVNCRGLPKMDTLGKADPYVSINTGNKKFKTQVIKNCLDPDWEDATYTVMISDENAEVVFKVFDDDMMRDEEIGRCSVGLDSLVMGQVHEFTEVLAHKSETGDRGTISFTLLAEDFGKEAEQ